MYYFGGESVKITLKLSVRAVITELFIPKMNYYFALLEIKSKENCLNLYKMLFS